MVMVMVTVMMVVMNVMMMMMMMMHPSFARWCISGQGETVHALVVVSHNWVLGKNKKKRPGTIVVLRAFYPSYFVFFYSNLFTFFIIWLFCIHLVVNDCSWWS